MTSHNAQTLTKRPAPGSLMAPPPAPKRIKRPAVVLDEDTYTSALEHIIRRDFFPGLAETDAQREYLNALESKDKSWIRESGKKLTQVMTPLPAGQRRRVPNATPMQGTRGRSETPKVWASDTPVSVAGTAYADEAEDSEKKPAVDLNLSLSAFQAKYISEDQESFSQVIDRENAKKFARNTWLRTNNHHPSKQRLAQQKALADSTPPSTTQQITLRPSQNLDDRPAAPESTKHAPFNALMFPPDSVESWAPTRAQTAESTSLAPPKSLVHANTRLPPAAPAPTRPPSPTLSTIRAAIAGHPRRTHSELGAAGAETPRVNGYAFVDAAGPEEEGDEEAPTDLLAHLARAGPSPFSITDPERREQLHHKMVERIGAQQRRAAGGNGNASNSAVPGVFASATPRFLSAPTPVQRGGAGGAGATPGRRNPGMLTPAAQRLFANMGGGTPRVGKGSTLR